MRRSSRRTFFRPKCTSVGIDNKASKPIISSYFIRAIDQIFWKLSPYWAFVLLGWYCFAYFWSKTTFINGGRVFQGLWQCRVLNTAMLVLRERTTLSLNKISVFFFSFAFLVCVCLCSRKKKWTSRCPLLRSLVYSRSLFWCFTKSDKINNYWNVKAVFCFLSKSANSFKAWKTTTTCSINKYQD